MFQLKNLKFIPALSVAIISILGSPLSAHHGPKWIELHSVQEILAIAIDSDNDGIFNWREEMIGADSDSADSDGDGFNDLFEDNFRAFGFNPLTHNMDSDNDGLTDSFENEIGTSIKKQDTDDDMLSDFDEVMNRRFGYHPLKTTHDSDFDGLTDRMEKKLGSSPNSPDSNNDGVSDFEAYYEGINPQEKFIGHFGEIIGRAYSNRMLKAIKKMRAGEPFPPGLAGELPYPAVTRLLYGKDQGDVPGSPGKDNVGVNEIETQQLNDIIAQQLSPSAALLQSGVAASQDITYITALYPTYNQIVTQFKDIASNFDGSPNPDIVRLFYWSEPTEGHRWIYALKISDNPELNEKEPELLFMGAHHGRELITASYTLELIKKLTNGYANADPNIQARVNGSEIWVIPVVNPDGYAMAQSEFAQGANVNWRKNTRQVLETSTDGSVQSAQNKGVDPNRNYDRSHIRTLPTNQRLALGSQNCQANGLTGFGHPTLSPCEGFVTISSTYAGGFGFSDVESRSVRMLADNQFNSGDEIDSLRCSLSWHTGGFGAILSPMNHDSPGTVSVADQAKLANLGNAFSAATGYFFYQDTWWTHSSNYQAFGTSDDWLYTHNGILPLTIEAYPQHAGNPVFFPVTFDGKKASVDNNMAGAMAFMNTCGPLRASLP